MSGIGNRLWLAVLVIWFVPQPAAATIRYSISLAHPEQHLFHVVMVISAPAQDTTITMPAWNALYQIRDFSYRVQNPRAIAVAPDDGRYGLRKLDKQTWQFEFASSTAPHDIAIEYSIAWDDPGPFDSQLNAHHVFMNLAEILMYVPDRRAEDVQLVFKDVPERWKMVAELPAGPDSHSFVAQSYDALVDAPTEAGAFKDFAFDKAGAHFRVVVDGSADRGRLEDALRRITDYELQLMGGAPFKQYTFLFHIGSYGDVGGGGMEHSNSTAIAAPSVESATTIAAHEFFHAWNVKRIRPQALEPVDYTKEQFTRALWFAEGVTSTYASYALERTGLWSKEEFYNDLAAQISELQSRPAHLWQSAEESSLDAWFEKYDYYNGPDRSISYYSKGQILGAMLDLVIRDATDNRRSLDDVLRQMNEEYARRGKFYDDSTGIQSIVSEVAGKPINDFFSRYVSGTEEIPYDAFLSTAGLALNIKKIVHADLGFSCDDAFDSGATVSVVGTGTPAEAAGVRAGDVIVALDGKTLPSSLPTWLQSHSPGDTARVRALRDGRELAFTFLLGAREDRIYMISEVSNSTDRQRRIREGLLHGTTN